MLRVVPELYCFDIEISKAFFRTVLGFRLKYERPHEKFAYLTRDGVDVMLEGLDKNNRQWATGELVYPLGRGINFQWDVLNIEEMYQGVVEHSPKSIYLPMELKAYQCGDDSLSQKQFIVQTPDGYLFRFCQEYPQNREVTRT